MFFRCLPVGPLQTNCYIIACENTKIAAIIDPGADPHIIVNVIKKYALSVKYIINTHGHPDHIGANGAVKNALGGELGIHKNDAPWLKELHPSLLLGYEAISEFEPITPDFYLEEGDALSIGNLKMEIIHTPGHSPGSVSLLLNDRVFTGDTLFCGGVGRTDLEGGSEKSLMDSIKKKLFILPENTLVFPGHGPSTTIGTEKKNNPYIL